MSCCGPSNGPRTTPQPHMIPGYMGYVPQYKYKFGSTYAQQTNRLYLDPCVSMSPNKVLTDNCPPDCGSGQFLQASTGFKYGQCGCNDPCARQTNNTCQNIETPRFQKILNNNYAPFCNRFCTKAFDQDQWRDRMFFQEKKAMDGWRYCYRSKDSERPDRFRPFDGERADQGRMANSLPAPIMKGDIDIFLRGFKGICAAPKVGIERYSAATGGAGGGGGAYAAESTGGRAFPTKKAQRQAGNGCPPCELYQRYMKGTEKSAKDAGLQGIVKHPLFPYVQGNPIRDCFCEEIEVLKKLNKKQMSRSPANVTDGIIEELGELPILTLHKLQQKLEDKSGLYYSDERGLARVCNPVGGSYLTARPFRCNTIYRYCEPIHPTFQGHVPGEIFLPGENRGKATRNATKYMLFRI